MNAQTTTNPSTAAISASTRTGRLAAITFAALFGAMMIFGAGLANSEGLHNAAHDARHAFGFPCH